MTAPSFPAFEVARKVAAAVLYEGYLPSPYPASAAKTPARWQSSASPCLFSRSLRSGFRVSRRESR